MGKKSSKTTNKTVYGNTTTTNPYVVSSTTNKGTTSAFQQGSAFDTINNFVNSNMNSLLEQYLNPTLNSVTNQAKLNALNNESLKSLENNIINPLSKRNMVRSSQATDMYNNLTNQNTANIANYANELIANGQEDMSKMLANLMLLYMNGYSAIADNQKQSLATSQGNATTTQKNTESGMSASDLSQLALQVALASLGV